jgi:phosphoribosylformylglycinamidine synthase II
MTEHEQKREPEVTDALIAAHGLSEEEGRRICEILGRRPNYTELGIFTVMWSEHVSYKSSRIHLKKLPTKSARMIQGPGENAGAVDIGEGVAAVFKMESHNHPSYVEPFQGAATGVGGILRDIFTMGARPAASLNSLRFGEPQDPRTRYLLDGVVGGIASYGNCFGCPTVGGEVYFNRCYNGNILVNVFNLGIAPADRIFKAVAAGAGNPVFYVGSKTGRDGIHGASLLASAEFDEKSEEMRPTVQVGDPFTEKVLLEACQELMAGDSIVGIQDMGAAGLTCSSVEMPGRGGTGIEIDLLKIPLREGGMIPYEIMLSESQERMLIVVRSGSEKDLEKIFRKWDLDAIQIGRVTDDGMLRLKRGEEAVARIPIGPLADDAPVYTRGESRPAYLDSIRAPDLGRIEEPKDLSGVFLRLLQSPNIGSRQWIWSQYDHTILANTCVLPGSDAAVIRVKGTKKALALTVDCNSLYCYLDPREGAKIAVAEAARNLAASGAEPVGLTDCLNFGNPEKPEIMWQFARSVEGIAEACLALGVPVVGGNVSFYNETMGRGIFPTPTIAMVGLIEDLDCVTVQWLAREGESLVLFGANRAELGGSEYLRHIHGLEAGRPPVLDLPLEIRVQEACREAARARIVSSAHDCSEGGLAVALAESCITGPRRLGAEISLRSDSARPDALLFGECQSRILLSLPRENRGRLEAIAERFGIPHAEIGRVGGDRIRMTVNGKKVVDTPVEEAHRAWMSALGGILA